MQHYSIHLGGLLHNEKQRRNLGAEVLTCSVSSYGSDSLKSYVSKQISNKIFQQTCAIAISQIWQM